MKLKPTSEQVVVIVGTSSGIGRVSAIEFARKGASVVASSRSITGLESLEKEVKQFGGKIITVEADTKNKDDIKNVFNVAIQNFGRIDTWVQNAGLWENAPFDDTTDEEFQGMLDVNLFGPIRAAREVIPYLRQQKDGGSLIIVTSVEARRPLLFTSAYSSAKHAADGFINSIRLEIIHNKWPINLVNILPSTMDTPGFEKSRIKTDGGDYKWVGAPPAYKPQIAAESIIYAASHECREIPIGTAGWLVMNIQKFAPSLVDWIVATYGRKLEKTSQPKNKDDIMMKPIEGHDMIEGEYFGKRAHRFSLFNWAYIHQNYIKGAAAVLIPILIAAIVKGTIV